MPYTKSKRASTASVSSFTAPQTPPPASSSNARPLGLVRPTSSPSTPTASTSAAGNDSPIRQPLPYRPASSAGAAWSHSGVGSSSSSPPPTSSGRPTPTQLASSALPFQSVSPGNSPFPPSTPNRTQSPAASATQHGPSSAGAARAVNGRASERVRAPYHSSFQPQGVRRDRTEDFMHKRKSRGEGKKLEEGRLGRRLEKVCMTQSSPRVIAESSLLDSSSLCIFRCPSSRRRRRLLRGSQPLHLFRPSESHCEARVPKRFGPALQEARASLSKVSFG